MAIYKLRLLSLSVFLVVSSTSSQAQNVTITPSSINVPALGVFIGGTQTSNYNINSATGTISRVSGNAFPTSKSGSVNTITISCTSCSGNAGNRTINVTISAGAPSGRFSITSFNRSAVTFTAGGAGSETGALSGSPMSFQIVFPTGTNTKTATFQLGMAFNLAATGGTGARPINYTINAARVNP